MATAADPEIETLDESDLRAELELLAAENDALREQTARLRQRRYRRSAAGLAALGVLAAAGALVFPNAGDVLFALAGTGLFAGVLTYFIAPERFVAANVGESTYDAYADNAAALVDELGLADVARYVPRGRARDPVRLFVPQHRAHTIPADDALDALFVVTDEPEGRGVSLQPTGGPLYREFRRTLAGPPADDPGELADQLADGLVEGFEIADAVTPDVDPGGERLTVAVSGDAYGDPDRFDHPVASFVAVGLAAGLERPVTFESVDRGDDRADYRLTYRWSTER